MIYVAAFLLAYLLIIVANCRVFRAVRRRDEQIEEMMRQDIAALPVAFRRTGTHV